MTSEVGICNMALGRIGHQRIDSLQEASPQAVDCRLFYAGNREALLQRRPWSFATGRRVLASLTAVDSQEWQHAYAWPSDCLSVRYVEPVADEGLLFAGGDLGAAAIAPSAFGQRAVPYEVRGKTVFTDRAEAAVVYTRDISDPTWFAPLFVQALAYLVAADLAMSRLRDEATRRDMLRLADAAIAEADLADGLQGTRVFRHPPPTLTVR